MADFAREAKPHPPPHFVQHGQISTARSRFGAGGFFCE